MDRSNSSRLRGKVALITGAARGQGRAHAVRLAEAGADIVAVDICAPVTGAPYPTGNAGDLAETARLVETYDRRILARPADVRDLPALRTVVAEAVAELGSLDIVVANAGILDAGRSWEIPEDRFQEMIDINLVGAWKTTTAAIPTMLEHGRGGSIVLVSSVAGLAAYPNLAHYVAAKHGVTGLMRALAVDLAPHGIRVNSVHPTSVRTPMIDNPVVRRWFAPHLPDPTMDDTRDGLRRMNALPVSWLEAEDVSEAVLHLASDESRHVTGTTYVLDAGATAPFRIPPP